MLRWLATAGIAALLVLDLALPWTGIGRRGSEAQARADVPNARGRVGETLPELSLTDLSGEAFQLTELRGRRVLLTFERSVDW
ncbi:MAG: hypothetical protein V3T33_04090 [Myxococcota bacterium]